MWMTDYIREIKRQFRDVYGFEPARRVGEEIAFGLGQIPDGDYPMTIDRKLDRVRVVNGRVSCCHFDEVEPAR